MAFCVMVQVIENPLQDSDKIRVWKAYGLHGNSVGLKIPQLEKYLIEEWGVYDLHNNGVGLRNSLLESYHTGVEGPHWRVFVLESGRLVASLEMT